MSTSDTSKLEEAKKQAARDAYDARKVVEKASRMANAARCAKLERAKRRMVAAAAAEIVAGEAYDAVAKKAQKATRTANALRWAMTKALPPDWAATVAATVAAEAEAEAERANKELDDAWYAAWVASKAEDDAWNIWVELKSKESAKSVNEPPVE